MDNREQSREEREKKLIDIQHGVTFAERLRSSEIIAKRLSASPAPTPDIAHLVRLLLSGVLLVSAFFVFSSDVPHKAAVGLASLTASFCLGVVAFRRHNKRG